MSERAPFYVWLADHLLHFGWAMFGQECECGDNRFNWLARRVHTGNWTNEGEPADLWTNIKWHIGNAFVSAHGWLLTTFDDERPPALIASQQEREGS